MPVLAIGAVDAVILIIALAILLLLWGGKQFFEVIGWLMSKLPFVGGYVSGIVNNAIKSFFNAAVAQWDGAVSGMAHLFWMLATGVWHLLYQTIATIADAKQWAVNAFNAAKGAEAGLAAGVAAAEAFAAQAAANALGQAENYAADAGTAAEQFSERLFNEATNAAQGLFDTAVTDAQDLFNTAEADVASAYNGAVGVAEGLYNDSIAHADDLYNSAITHIEDAYNSAVGVINADVAQVLAEAETYADDAAAAAAALSVAGLLTRVGVLEAEATECLEPLCDTITPNAPNLGNLGQLLKDLEGLAAVGVLTALLAEAATNPKQAAHDVEDVAGWMAPLGLELVQAIGLNP